MAGRSRLRSRTGRGSACPPRSLILAVAIVAALLGSAAPAAALDPAHTATIFVGGYDGGGARRQGLFGTDEQDALLDSIAALAGVPVAGGDAVLPPNVAATTSYYGDTPPPSYAPADVAELDSVTTAWGGGVPRYALIVAKYARDVLRRSGAQQVNFIGGSFGSLIVRWLIEKDLEGLADQGRIARWLSVEGLIAGNWEASRTELVQFLDFLDPLPIDVAHMSYSWVDANLHSPRTEADDPAYAGILIGQVVSTDDSDNHDALSLLMESYREFQPNDGVQAVADAGFRSVTARSRFDGLPPTLAVFHTDHLGIRQDHAAWSEAATFATQGRRVTVTMTSAQVTDLHEPEARYWDWRPAEVVLESRVTSPAMAARWGIRDPVCTIEKEGAIAPLRYYNSDGETQTFTHVVFDDLVLAEETQLDLALHAEEIDYDWRYGVYETTRPPYYDDLGSGELAVSTLTPGTYTFHAASWNCALMVAVHDYPLASPAAVGEGPATVGRATLSVSPNPSGGRVRVVLAGLAAQPGPLRGTLEVFDITGRRVWRVEGDPRQGIVWDGRDDAGHVLPAGLYLEVVTTAAGRWEGKSLRIR